MSFGYRHFISGHLFVATALGVGVLSLRMLKCRLPQVVRQG